MVRFLNSYGDPAVWSVQKTQSYTFLSFMNITKYPPSLLFTLVTLGTMFFILGITESVSNWATRIPEVYGKVPLFYFLVHFFLIHVILIIILLIQGTHFSEMNFPSGTFGRPKGKLSGISLEWVYLIWAGVVAILYKPYIWFGQYKTNHNYWWLRYI